LKFSKKRALRPSYWNLAFGRDPGDMQNDKEGLATLRDLAENMAWLMEKLYV
jgi:hypothetical protein